MPDTRIYDALTDLAACLCAEVGEELCACGVMPGEVVAEDYVTGCTDRCGMGWVRLITVVPAVGVNVPAVRSGNCTVGLGFDAEIAIVRCVPGGDDQGNPPPVADMAAAALVQMDDMMAMRRAVACCSSSKDWAMGQYTPIGPQGGVLGGLWTLTMLVV